jgi:hypothetical protein
LIWGSLRRKACGQCYIIIGKFLILSEARGTRALDVDDTLRAAKALKGVVGKRLTYRQPDSGSEGGAEAEA